MNVRTKLCIRDSLYRLARSAEQRHNCANQRGGIRDNGDAIGSPMVEETNKYVTIFFPLALLYDVMVGMMCGNLPRSNKGKLGSTQGVCLCKLSMQSTAYDHVESFYFFYCKTYGNGIQYVS